VNEFLRELATLGLGMGVLVLLGIFAYLGQRSVRERFMRQRDRRVRHVLLALLGAACLGIAVWFVPVLDAPRRPLFDYVGIMLALACLGVIAALARELLAGLQLRLRGAVPAGASIRAGDYAGRVSQRGLLQVVITTANGDSVHLPNRYLLRVPIRQIADGSVTVDLQSLAHESRSDAVRELSAAGDREPAPGFWPAAAAPAVAERREPTLSTAAEFNDSSEPAPLPSAVKLAAPEPAKPILDSKSVAELTSMKNEYTDLSQQLLEVERALQAAGQGEERQPLSLEKKKLEARLFRLAKQISQLEAGERLRA
jgi:Mechanosensitive ion channel